ncbi:MAG: MFS transporter, partial [Myxococcales bacterium]|nr:MFS transporter [Myxococcales bacterium]
MRPAQAVPPRYGRDYARLTATATRLRKYWLADAVSLIGDWLSYVAVAVLVVEAKGGWTALATVLVLHTLPASLASPVAGWLTDRMDARRLMVLSALLRGLLTLAMTAAAANGSLLWLQLCLFVRMAVGSSEHTAGRAVLKRVVATEELGLANAIGGATWSLLFALGVAMGGVVASQVGPIWALVLDAATFFLSAGLLLRLPALPATPTPAGGQDERGLGEAIALARRTPVLRALVFGKMPLALATGGAWVFLNHVAERLDSVRDTALAIGLLQTARAIGTGLGPFAQRRYDGGSHRGP